MSFNAELFNRTASLYDEKPPFFSVLGAELVEFAALPYGATVLDIGAGKGAVTLPALCAVGPSGHVTAVDVSERMVEHLKGLGLANLTALQDDIEYSALPDASIDHAISGFALHIVGNLGNALFQIHRVLKDRGTISWSKPGGHPDALEWESAYGNIYASFTHRLSDEPPEMVDEPNVDAVIANSGFDVCDQKQVPVSIPVGGAEAYWQWTQSHGARWLTDKLSSGDAQELKTAVVDSLRKTHPTQGRDILVAPLFTKMQRR